jgi:uncharacterized LabA/DUF88 family protein
MKTTFLIDGFNFYYSIKQLNRQLRWFDYKSFCIQFLHPFDSLDSIYYFTSIAHWLPDVANRHKIFIEALKTKDINVVLGKFKDKQRCCNICENCYNDHEEKQTDVNIALYAYRLASKSDVDKIIIISADSDLVPSIKLIKEDFPKKRVGIIFPLKRGVNEMRQFSDFHIKTKMEHLINCQLPDQISIQNGKMLTRPLKWA